MEGLAQGHHWLLVTASFNPVQWGSTSICSSSAKLIPASYLHPPQSSPKGTKHLPLVKPPQQRQVGCSTAWAPQGSSWLRMAAEGELELSAG